MKEDGICSNCEQPFEAPSPAPRTRTHHEAALEPAAAIAKVVCNGCNKPFPANDRRLRPAGKGKICLGCIELNLSNLELNDVFDPAVLHDTVTDAVLCPPLP